MQELVRAYQRDGVGVVKGAFSQEDVNRIRSAAFMAMTRLSDISANGYRHPALETVDRGVGPSPALLFWPTLASPVLNEYRAHPCLQQIVRSILGQDVKQLNNQIYFRLPGDGDTFAWHQDIMFREPRADYPGIVENNAYLQTAIIVDRMSRENGAIEFVLGSHLLGDLGLPHHHEYTGLRGFERERTAARFKHLATRVVEADPGDVLVWSALTVHGSQSNSSPHHRMYYMNGFANAEHARPWPYYLRAGQMPPLDPTRIP